MLSSISKQFLKAKSPLIITGAGLSTDSNIPDYRGENGAYKNEKFKPITLQHFMANDSNRKRYWLRSYLGWKTINNAIPNDSHMNITRLEYLGGKVITQNVDSLHKKAGSSALELHGTLFKVECQACYAVTDRNDFQNLLSQMNPLLKEFKWSKRVNPDGDAEVQPEQFDSMNSDGNAFDFVKIPECSKCGGILKPKVVYFGESINIKTRAIADQILADSDFLLVVGSTLTTYSAFRFLHQLKHRNHFTASISLGPSRGDDLFDVKISKPMKDVLPDLLQEIMKSVGEIPSILPNGQTD